MVATSVRSPARTSTARVPTAARQELWKWYVAGALLAFGIPVVGADLLELHHDLYLLVYFTLVGTFLASFAAHHALGAWLRSRIWWSALAGALIAVPLVQKVLAEDAMPHPTGAFFWFETAWRGLVYGAVDALLLFAFPAAIAHLALRERAGSGRVRVALLTLALSIGITATYHLGYPQFRDTDLVQPEIGALVAWVPTAMTGNPVGGLVVHDAYHVAANTHTYRSEIYLPPDLDGYAERGAGTTGTVIAAAWLLAASAAIYTQRQRLFLTDER